MNMLDEALRLAELGWYVLPCHTPILKYGWNCSCESWRRKKAPDYNCSNPGKHPRTSHGLDDASNDPEQIREWWKQWPSANIGVNCGMSGILMVDRDSYKDNYRGHDLELDENTVTAISGGGGGHLYYRMEPGDPFGNSTKGLPAGIDIRGHGGLVIVAPSLHESGNRYQWELDYGPWDVDMAPIPPNLREILEARHSRSQEVPLRFDTAKKYNGAGASAYGQKALESECVLVAKAAEGGRNNTLNAAAFAIGQLVAGGEIDHDYAFGKLLEAAIAAGLSDVEAKRTTESGMDAGMKHPKSSKPLGEDEVEKTWAVVDCPDPALLFDDQTIDRINEAVQEAKKNGKIDFAAIRKIFAMIAGITDKYILTHLRNTLPKQLDIKKSDYDSFLTDARQERIEEPANKPDTWPYLIHDAIIQVMVKTKDGYERMPVAMFTAQITEQHVSEAGQIFYMVKGQALRGGAFTVLIDADSFSNNQKLKAALETAAGPHDPVMARMEPHLGAAIKMLSSDSVQTIKRYERTGWAGDNFLIPGKEPENTLIHLSRKMPYRISEGADLALGIEAFDALIEFVGPVVGAFLLQPPMALYAGWRDERYGLFVRGRTGTQKSSSIQVGMCLYGPDFIRDDMLLKWGEGATRNAIMGYATMIHDLPFLVDNYKPNTGGGTSDFINLIHNILEGGEKERMNRAAQLRDTKPIYSWPVFTGEDLPDSDAASLARLLAITLIRKEDTSHLSTAQRLSPHLCAVGASWIAWLETEHGKRVAKEMGDAMPAVRAQWSKTLLRTQPNMANPYRVATNLAINQLVWTALSEHPDLKDLAAKHRDAHTKALSELANDMSVYTTQSVEALRLIELMRSLLASGRVILLRDRNMPAEMSDPVDRDRVIGWDIDGAIYVLPEMLLASVKRATGDALNNISRQALYDQLDGLGFIASKGSSGITKPMRLGGKVQKVLHLKSEAVDLEDEDMAGL